MSSESQDWTALASYNERLVPAPTLAPQAGPEPHTVSPWALSRLQPAHLVMGRLRIRRRAAGTGSAAVG
jgi:hypothetical protein